MSTTTELSDAEIARRAADHIEKVGLHKGDAYKWPPNVDTLDPSTVPCCVIGAIGLMPSHRRWEVESLLDQFVRDTEPDFHFQGWFPRPVAQWNDAPERTQEEVVAKLREFADYLDSKENDK